MGGAAGRIALVWRPWTGNRVHDRGGSVSHRHRLAGHTATAEFAASHTGNRSPVRVTQRTQCCIPGLASAPALRHPNPVVSRKADTFSQFYVRRSGFAPHWPNASGTLSRLSMNRDLSALPRKRGTLAHGRCAKATAWSGLSPVRVPPLGGVHLDYSARFMVPMRYKSLVMKAFHETNVQRPTYNLQRSTRPSFEH